MAVAPLKAGMPCVKDYKGYWLYVCACQWSSSQKLSIIGLLFVDFNPNVALGLGAVSGFNKTSVRLSSAGKS